MTSIARANLLEGLAAFESAIAQPAVISPSAEGAFLRRGLAVAVFNLFEGFMLERLEELATFINTGHLHFSDLPAKLQQQAVRNVLEVAAARVRNVESGDMGTFSQTVGTSLAATTGGIALSSFTWAWKGSNMAVADYATALKLFHVNEPFPSVLEVSRRLGFSHTDVSGKPLRLGEHLQQFAETRHAAAHSSKTAVSVMWLGTRVDLVKRFAVGFDATASLSAFTLRSGDQAYISDSKWCTPSRLVIRSVVERARDSAEHLEGRKSAVRVNSDGDVLFREAATRTAHGHLLARFDRSGKLVDWATPTIS